MKMRRLFLPVILVGALFCGACSQNVSTMQDGYYTAEAAAFDSDGWKDFITIYVSHNKIITVEYNAKNVSGFIKSWDMYHMRGMKLSAGTYPNKYSRDYAAALVNKQDPSGVLPIPGAKKSHALFQLLADAAIAQAKAGDKRVVFVKWPNVNGEIR